MDGPPALSVTLCAPAWWRRGVGLLLVLAAASLAAWAVQAREALSSPTLAIALVCGALPIVAAATLLRLAPAQLRWDGSQWHLAAAPAGDCRGVLSVAVDAGAWMLLRFDAAGAAPMALRRRWLPASRRGLGGDWHTLRCAVYSPRPAPGGSSAAARPASPE